MKSGLKKGLFPILLSIILLMGSMTVFAADEVAEVNGAKYPTVQAAVDAANDGEVKLLASVTEDIIIPKGKSVTLNLNSFTLTGKEGDTISNNGSLTITGTGTVQNSLSGKGVLVNYPGATAALNGGTFTATGWYTLKNMGTMTIQSPAAVNTTDGRSSLIANGWYGNGTTNDRNVSPSGNPATLTISGGTFDGGMNTVKNDDYGVLNITGGTFENTSGPTIMNWNKTTISGGDFSVPSEYVLSNGYGGPNDLGELVITGGKFTSGNNGEANILGWNDGATAGKGTLSISNATMNGAFVSDANLPYDVAIKSGAFSSEIPADCLAEDMAHMSVTSGGKTTYYVDSPSGLAATIKGVAPNSEINILAGAVQIGVNDIPEGVEITDSQQGSVTIMVEVTFRGVIDGKVVPESEMSVDIPKGESVTQEELDEIKELMDNHPELQIEGYVFKGFFLDGEGKTALEAGHVFNDDSDVYMIWEKKSGGSQGTTDKPAVDKPAANKPAAKPAAASKVPQTGDTAHTSLYLIMMLGAAGVVAVTAKKKSAK